VAASAHRRRARRAPSLPKLAEIEKAMEVVAVCVERAALQVPGG
jgi:hypothetical protein